MPTDRHMGEQIETEPQRAREEEAGNDAWWRRIYLAVIIFTALVILGLWGFSRAFSS